jgi:hypothetical protein
VVKAVQFIPKFKGAAEMEARRRVRMAARQAPVVRAPPPKALSFDTSSEEDEPSKPAAVDSSDEVAGNDEFDPYEFLCTHICIFFLLDLQGLRGYAFW